MAYALTVLVDIGASLTGSGHDVDLGVVSKVQKQSERALSV
jgi:hypothetical protein